MFEFERFVHFERISRKNERNRFVYSKKICSFNFVHIFMHWHWPAAALDQSCLLLVSYKAIPF